MIRLVLAVLIATALALPASADCYVDYKAKQDNPLVFHYGVAQLDAGLCSRPKLARANLADRLAAGGWTLLKILSTFGPEGLDERKASAGEYFLRY